jgi:ankyrin repeat protein
MQRWVACIQLRVIDGLVGKIQQTMAGCRAAAAARIAGSQPWLHDIISATKHNDIALVADHLLVNPGLVNAMDICGTPLHWAATNGSIRICELLLQSGADVNASSGRGNYKGYSPLHNCIRSEDTNLYFRIDFFSVCRLLVESKADLTALDHYGYSPLRRAICCNQRDIADYLRSVGAKEGPEPHRWE